MRSNMINAEELVIKVNEFRMNTEKEVFSRQEICSMLGISKILVTGFVKANILNKTRNGLQWDYSLVSEEPVHIQKVNAALEAMREYTRRSVAKKHRKENPEQEDIDSAIELLKKLGYKIQKPVVITKYEEV